MSDDDRRRDELSLEALHRLAGDGDGTALEALCAIVLVRLRARLRRLRPDADPALVENAVEDATLKYCRDPTQFKPWVAGLLTWLERVALNRLEDYERPNRRALAHIAASIDPERLDLVALPESPDGLTDGWLAEHRARLLAATRTDAERAFVIARLAGASRDEQARALGVAHLPPAEARREMNRVWQLIVRRARRREDAEHET